MTLQTGPELLTRTPKPERIGRRALIVSPVFPKETDWSFHATIEHYLPPGEHGLPKHSHAPLGALSLAGFLKPYYESVVVFDRNVDPRSLEELTENGDHVHISAMNVQEADALAVARDAKRLGLTTFAGGPIVTPASPLLDVADHLVQNEAELVLPQLLRDFGRGAADRLYKGESNVPPERFWRPDYTAINPDNYVTMSLQTSRGCPYTCEFCDIWTRFGNAMRYAPFDAVQENLEALTTQGWRGPVFFVDDNFLGNPPKTAEMLESLIGFQERTGIVHPWTTELSVNLGAETERMRDLRALFRRAGADKLFLGVESPNPDTLAEMGKRQNKGDLVASLERIAAETGAELMIGMILGADQDTPGHVREYAAFVNSLPTPMTMYGLLTALEGTNLADRLRHEGRLLAHGRVVGESAGNNSDGRMNFIPMRMSMQEAEEAYLELRERIFSPEAYFGRVIHSLRYREPRSNSPATAKQVLTKIKGVLTDKHSPTYLRHLPAAHRVAKERFGTGTPGYYGIIKEYLLACGKFRSLRGQTDHLARERETREYAPIELRSWEQLRAARVEAVAVETPAPADAPDPTLYETIRVRLADGLEMVDTRLEVMRRFVEPHLRDAFQRLQNRPSFDELKAAHLDAYRSLHHALGDLLGADDFARVEPALARAVAGRGDYHSELRHLHRSVKART